MRFLYVNFKIFSKISNLNWFFAQTRKILSLGFLISFRIIKNFQNSVKLPLIFIKISVFKSKFAKNSGKFSKSSGFHWFFYWFFNIFASFAGLHPRSPYKSIFPKFFLTFSRIHKIAKFPKKFSKNKNFSLIFNIFWKFSSLKKPKIFAFSHVKKYPPPPIRKILYKLLHWQVLRASLWIC